MKIRKIIFISWCLIALAPAALAGGKGNVKLATTTSTENSGLLDYLLPEFEKKTGIKVDVIAVGTGKALKHGENGDVDVLMVHAPAAEQAFMDAGYGVNRRELMQNDFIIVGPPEDPAKIGEAENLKKAIKALCTNPNAVFISRGDDSGTHKKEKFLWDKFSCKPEGKHYSEIGQGMSAALRVADEKKAYTLADRGTYLALKDTLELVICFEGAEELNNPYSVIAVNPARYSGINYMGAMTFIAWLTSPEGQAMIGAYKKYGEVLFHPLAVPEKTEK